MRQYHVHRCHDALALVTQSHLIPRTTPFTLVAPVVPSGNFAPIPKLDVPVLVGGRPHLIMVSQLASVRTGRIGNVIADLSDHADDVRAALDFLTQGF